MRDADELHDALLTLVAVPPVDAWQPWFDELVAQHRATTLSVGGAPLWTCAERRALTRVIYPEATRRTGNRADRHGVAAARATRTKPSPRCCAAGSSRAAR